MKFPQTELLDVLSIPTYLTVSNWKKSLLKTYLTNFFFINSLNAFRYFLLKKKLFLNRLLRNMRKFTITHSLVKAIAPILVITRTKKIKIKYSSIFQVKKKKTLFKRIKKKFNSFFLLKALFSNSAPYAVQLSFLNNLFDINFLRKEKLYTKLKYSRVPQYDIVSGGAAALLAGFLGFLICEKFGFELIDSGDFYIAFMYVVFLFFSSRLVLKIINATQETQAIWNFQFLYFYTQTISLFIFKFFNAIFAQLSPITRKILHKLETFKFYKLY